MTQKQVAIIGSGCSGLAAIKACVDEGLNPVCFESSDDIGGLWRFSSDLEDGREGSVSSSTIMNTSKEMMAYSLFPPPDDFPNFMHHSKVLEYYRLFAERFQLRQYIRFNTQVDYVQPNKTPSTELNTNTCTSPHHNNAIATDSKIGLTIDSSKCKLCCDDHVKMKTNNFMDSNSKTQFDFNQNVEEDAQTSPNTDTDIEGVEDNYCLNDDTKAWAVRFTEKVRGQTKILHFDFVLVCTGHHAYINMPEVPGQSQFQGQIAHSRDLREPDKLKGRRHVVVGVGNSGCDTAVELSKRSKVFLSTRRGTWLMHRLQSQGLPADIAFSNRLVFATAFSLPNTILNALSARHLNQKIDHNLYGLKPRHGPIAAHPTVNDELPNRIACGQVTVKTNIRRLEGRKVYFEDGTEEEDIDTLILATGYHIKYPFLDDAVVNTDSNVNPLYLYMFPTALATHSLAIIGCVQPGGALAPVSEMQCRLAVKVFKGEVNLPSPSNMVKDIQMKTGAMKSRYVTSPRHTVQVDYIPYMDQLAAMIGCKPNIGRMFLQDPSLAIKCFIGPCTAYQYRLQGPGRWGEAREAIMTQMERVVCPLATRACHDDPVNDSKTSSTSIYVVGMGVIFMCLAYAVYLAVLFMGTWWWGD